MSNWKRWDDATLNASFAGIEHPDRIVFPDLRDDSPLVLASDYSGEHGRPEFQVLSFLLTTYKSISVWDPLRASVRKEHLVDKRRMSFKDLSDALRINALPSFLDAANQLNGVLLCVAVEKGYSFRKFNLPTLQHDWAPESLKKLLEICVFGGVVVDGLRGRDQSVHWITDDDAIVSTDKAQIDAMNLMGGILHKYPDEQLRISLGIASKFADERRAEDLVAIPDLAAGAFSEQLTTIGNSNMPTSGSGPSSTTLFLQIKSTLINTWRSAVDNPLKHMNAMIRIAPDGQTLLSFGAPFSRMLRPGESAEGAPTLNSKWRRALEAYLAARGVDPDQVLRLMGIDV